MFVLCRVSDSLRQGLRPQEMLPSYLIPPRSDPAEFDIPLGVRDSVKRDLPGNAF